MYGDNPDQLDRDSIYYITLYNENYVMPALPDHRIAEFEAGAVRGLYRWASAPDGHSKHATILFSGVSYRAARGAVDELAQHYDVGAELWSATSYKRLREEALRCERHNRLHPTAESRLPMVTRLLEESSGPITAVSDFMKIVPEQIARFAPTGRAFTILGTDGMGRSDTRDVLRRLFEIDTGHVVVGVLTGLALAGEVDRSVVGDAIRRYDIDPEATDPTDL